MSKIGFKVTDSKLVVVNEPAQVEPLTINAEQLIRAKGRERLFQLVDEYIQPCNYPLLKGEKRDEFFMQRLRRINERYFEAL